MIKKPLIGLVAAYGIYLVGSAAMASMKLKEVETEKAPIAECINTMNTTGSMNCEANKSQ